MKLPHKQLEEILRGMEKMLSPVTEKTTVLKNRKGSYFLARGITHGETEHGITFKIEAEKLYTASEFVRVPVNHRRRMKVIIDQANTIEEMREKLAEYLAKFGSPENFISQSN